MACNVPNNLGVHCEGADGGRQYWWIWMDKWSATAPRSINQSLHFVFFSTQSKQSNFLSIERNNKHSIYLWRKTITMSKSSWLMFRKIQGFVCIRCFRHIITMNWIEVKKKTARSISRWSLIFSGSINYRSKAPSWIALTMDIVVKSIESWWTEVWLWLCLYHKLNIE